jgi:DNA-binding NtrC family response regulator
MDSPRRARVLYADDEADVREVFAAVLGEDLDVVTVESGADALQELARADYDVLVSDMRMDPMKGSDLLAAAFRTHPDTRRILLTGYSDHDDLAVAVNEGHLFAYLQKPWDLSLLRLTIQRATEARHLELENRRLLQELRNRNKKLEQDMEAVVRTGEQRRPALLADSRAMQKVLSEIDAVAETDVSVLISGETGSGKELVAATIHERSARKRGRFIAQNLAALPPDLMTSELFGHVKGAFTGAQQARRGLFELADGGTLFLDEIGEAPHALQALLLRALETREFWPVGASEPRRVDVRIVAATNRDLLSLSQAGQFRSDLYYRLAVCPIRVPPLRERPEDLHALAERALATASQRMSRPSPRLAQDANRALEGHDWPGNVRELINLMERLCIYFPGKDVSAEDLNLPPRLGTAPASLVPESMADVAPLPEGTIQLDMPQGGTTFDALEREILARVLERADGNQSRAARSLGLSESTFRSRLKRLGLKG